MFFENLREAITSIFSNKMRSALTILGIVIGIGAVITITTIGESIRNTLNASFNALGGNAIQVYLEARYPETDEEWETWEYPELTKDDAISDEMIEDLETELADVVNGVNIENYLGEGKVSTSYDHYANVVVEGASISVIEMYKLKIKYGRMYTQDDVINAKSTCIIPDTMAKNYFENENPIGQIIEVDLYDGKTVKLTVVGVYRYDKSLFGKPDPTIPEKDRPQYIFTTHTAVKKYQTSEEEGYRYLDLMVNPALDVKEATNQIGEFLNTYYEDNKNWHITTYNSQEDLKIINVVINVVTIAISFIAAISLVVGGVGVMNIMLVSITERTKEIGVRMAMGAKKRVIRTQFVIEAIVLCLIGGLVGIIIGVTNGFVIGLIANLVVNNFYPDYAKFIIITVQPSAIAILLSVFFSMLTGVFFGFYPANKAAKMEVIDALRYE